MDASATIRLARSPLPKVGVKKPETWLQSLRGTCDASDETLLARVCQGDQESLAQLFRRYSGLVRGVAYRVLHDKSEADDLLQDIFLLIRRLSATFDSSRASARFWILQLTHRRAISRRRYLTTRHFYKRLDLDEVADELPDPRVKIGSFEDTVDGMFGPRKAEQMLAILSENQRLTLRLYFVEGYTLKEIAQKLGQSSGNIRHHYFRGLERLRKELLKNKFECQRAVL